MADKKPNNLPILPKNLPKKITVTAERMDYSEVKLHIPKDKKGNTTLEKPWYIWFNFRNPTTGKFDNRSKIKKYNGINRYYKTISERKQFGKNLIATYTKLLQEGYNPFEQTLPANSGLIDFSTEQLPFLEAFDLALEEKRISWSEGTRSSNKTIFTKFTAFIEQQHLAQLPASQINRKHITSFLKLLTKKGLNPKTVNNYKAEISSVFSKMMDNEHVDKNPCLSIKKLKENPLKNHPFTSLQVDSIKKELGKNSKLLKFMQVMAYSFLRNSEVLRLQVKDVDLKNRILTSRNTKTSKVEKIFIIDQLYNIFKKMKLEKKEPEDFIFSRNGNPGPWVANLRTKKKVYSDIFSEVKKKLNLGPEFSIYSIRHTFAYNLYKHFEKQGFTEYEIKAKMLPITRHRSIAALENYLRDLIRMMPKDYSDKLTFDF